MQMTSHDYAESLRLYRPRVFVDGRLIDSVADEPALRPGINAVGLTYDYALRPEYAAIMTAVQAGSGKTVNRLLHINTSSGDLLNKLEAVRLVCQETGCAQRYLTHDALNAIHQVAARIDDAQGSTEHRARFAHYLQQVQDRDLTLGVATDTRESLANREYLLANVQKIVAERERLLRELPTVGYLEPFPSHTNFILSRVVGRDALGVKLALQDRGVLIRHYGHPRIRDCIRISVGRPDQNDRVLAALREV